MSWWQRLRALFGRDRGPALPKGEIERRLELAMTRSREEISALMDDGEELAARIRRNRDQGRHLLGGKL